MAPGVNSRSIRACGRRRHVGEEDAHLAIFDAPSGPAILLLDASRFAATFGEATFIQDKDGEEGFGLSTRRPDRGRVQSLADKGAQFIAHPILIPGRSGEEALNGIRLWQPGVFGDLPAIFARDVAQDGLQVQQGVLEDFGASEEGRQAALPLTQAERPGGDLSRRWSLLHLCAIIRILHAFLVSDGVLAQRVEMRVACHI